MSDWLVMVPRLPRVRTRCEFAAAVAVCFYLSAAAAICGQLTAVVEPDAIRMGETAQLTLNFENARPTQVPGIPSIPNLQVSYVGSGETLQIVNMRQSSIVSLNYALTPAQPGEYTIPALSVRVGNETLTSQPVKLTVLKQDELGNAAGAQAQLAFVKLVVAKTNVFIGEVLPVEIQLYHAVPAQDLQLQPLSGEGFTFGKTRELPQRQVRVGNTVYFLHQLQGTAIANKTGELELSSVECNGVLEVPLARRRTGNPFEDMFNDPFFGPRYERRRMKVSSSPVSVRVEPLPEENKPADFTGAVGQFSFVVTASPTNVAVGEPVHMKVRVEGKGPLESIALPPLDAPSDFATYPPVSSVDTTDPLGVEGARVFQYDLVPQKGSIRELPSLGFSYFDPAQRKYRSLKSQPLPIIVRPGGLSPSLASPQTGSSASEPSRDIVHLKPRLGVYGAIAPPLIRRPWFMAIQTLPLLAWFVAIAWRKRRDHLARNPRLVRRQEVSRTVRRGLKELAQSADAHDTEKFFALMFRLLQEQIGERLDLPAAAITDAITWEQLRPRGAPPDLVATLDDLFLACNQQRYAPTGSGEDLQALLSRVREALKQVRSLNL